MTQQATTFTASFSETAEFERLEDGVYQSTVVGVLARDFPGYEDKTKMVEKVQFIIQVAQDGTCFYFRTKPMLCVLGERSNMMIFLNSATGATLEKVKEKYPVGFPLQNLIGLPVQAVVNTVTGKDGKEYANLANVLKAKKGTKTAVAPDAIPAYLVRGAKNYNLAEGLTVKEEAPKAETFPAGLPGGIASGRAAATQAPANAQITQNQNPAAFMNPGAATLQVTAPAQAPAQNPQIQTAGQALAQEGLAEDDDSDLPF
jgi:hypothetical protein